MKSKNINNLSTRDFKLKNGFLKSSITQEIGFQLGNGVILDDKIKKAVNGSKFDKALQKAGYCSRWGGVAYGYWDKSTESLVVYSVLDYISIPDEETNNQKLGIRFWQISEDKPMYIEVFNNTHVTRYKQVENGLELVKQSPHSFKMFKSAVEETVINVDEFPEVPVFPLYANEDGESVLTEGLQEYIDAHDFVNSDLISGIVKLEGILLFIKDLGGQEVEEVKAIFEELKATYVDDEQSNIDAKSIELPYQAKKFALEYLEKKMYSDTMTLNLEEIKGGSLTNVAINTATMNFNIKLDDWELYLIEFVQNILKVAGFDNVEPKFQRRSIQNDTEIVQNLSTMLTDSYIDEEFAINHNPLIPEDEKKPLLLRISTKQQEEAENRYTFDSEVVEDGQSTQSDRKDNQPDNQQQQPNVQNGRK